MTEIFKKKGDKPTSIVPSKFDEEYYKLFNCSITEHTSSPIFKVELDASDDPANKYLGKQNKVYIYYANDVDYFIIDKVLTDEDKNILLFIDKHRNVQFYQILKEFNSLTSMKIKKTLEKLHKYYLIEKYKFNRYDKKSEYANSYSVNRNGAYYLLHRNLITNEQNDRVFNKYQEVDSFKPIRSWKICDAYQLLKRSPAYKEYIPRLIHKKEMIEVVKKGKVKEYRSKYYIKSLLCDGTLKFFDNNKEEYYYFELFPIVNENDIVLLKTALEHNSLLKQKYDRGEINERHYLTIIIDDWSILNKIDKEYPIKELDANLLFLDLDTIHNENCLQSLFYFDEKFKILNFPIEID